MNIYDFNEIRHCERVAQLMNSGFSVERSNLKASYERAQLDNFNRGVRYIANQIDAEQAEREHIA